MFCHREDTARNRRATSANVPCGLAAVTREGVVTLSLHCSSGNYGLASAAFAGVPQYCQIHVQVLAFSIQLTVRIFRLIPPVTAFTGNRIGSSFRKAGIACQAPCSVGTGHGWFGLFLPRGRRQLLRRRRCCISLRSVGTTRHPPQSPAVTHWLAPLGGALASGIPDALSPMPAGGALQFPPDSRLSDS